MPFLPPWTPADPFILFHGLVAATAFPLFFLLVALRGALFYSQTTYVIAISGILWGMVVFGERPTPLFWGAVVLVLGGLVLTNRPLPPAP
jgi:drug/metabolite transporter (DMT)-like permease